MPLGTIQDLNHTYFYAHFHSKDLDDKKFFLGTEFIQEKILCIAEKYILDAGMLSKPINTYGSKYQIILGL